jgi:alkylhydroperoxidase family enzyme
MSRIPDADTPEFRQLAAALVKATSDGSVPTSTITLLYLRAGQIVGSTYQTIRHSTSLRAAGESEERITGVATWWDAPCFTEAERAALALTEAVLQPHALGQERVPDELFGEVSKHYDGTALATLMAAVATASFWMAIALIHKPTPAGLDSKAA